MAGTLACTAAVLVAVAALSVAASAPGRSTAAPGVPIPPYTTHWFNQTLDHFNSETRPRHFLQRYLISDQHWSPAGDSCVFMYMGNEVGAGTPTAPGARLTLPGRPRAACQGPIEQFYNNSGLLFEFAPAFKALVVFAEHRYYGAVRRGAPASGRGVRC